MQGADIFADLPRDDLTRREPDEPWFIEPRDRSPASEIQRQGTVITGVHRLAPTVTVWAVPNAARRTRWEAMRAKKEGMLAGALDLTLVWPRSVFFAEMKDGREMPTPEQRAMLNYLYRAGHHCGVFRTAACLLDKLREAGAPVREARFF